MIDNINLTGKLRENTALINSFVCKTSIFHFQGRNINCQGSYFHAAFTVYSFVKRNVGRNAPYVPLKSFLLCMYQFLTLIVLVYGCTYISVFTSWSSQLAYIANSYQI